VHDQIPELVLEHDRHFLRMFLAQAAGDLHAVAARVEGNEEMMIAGQPAGRDVGEHLFDDAAQRVLGEQVVPD
jgi:hypothetical protein